MNAEELEVEVLIAYNEAKAANERFEHLMMLRAGGVVMVDAIYMRHHAVYVDRYDTVEEAQQRMEERHEISELAPVCLQRGGLLLPAEIGDPDPEHEYTAHYLHGLLREAYS